MHFFVTKIQIFLQNEKEVFDNEMKESKDTTTIQSNTTTTANTEGSPLPLFNDTDFTTSKPSSAETTEYNSVRDTTTRSMMLATPEFATVVSDTVVTVPPSTPIVKVELAFSDILAANLPVVADDVSLPQTDTVVTTKEMINLEAAAVPDFSVYDMDTFSKDLGPDFEPSKENTIFTTEIQEPDFEVYDTLREVNTLDTFPKDLMEIEDYDTAEIQQADFEIYDTLRDVNPINQVTSDTSDTFSKDLLQDTDTAEIQPDFAIYDTLRDVNLVNQVNSDTSDTVEIEQNDTVEIQPDFEIYDTVRDVNPINQVTSDTFPKDLDDTDTSKIQQADFEIYDTIRVTTAMPEEKEFATKMDTIESTVSNTASEPIPDFGIIEDVTAAAPPKIQNVSSTTKKPNLLTNTTTVSNTVNDEPTTSITTVSNTAVTTALFQGETTTISPPVVLEDNTVPDLSVFQTIRETTLANTDDQNPVDGMTTLSLFLQSLFTQLSQSSPPSNVSVPVSSFNFTEALFNSLNQTLAKVPEEEGEAFSSLLFQSLPPTPP